MYALNFSIDNISLMALAISVGFVVDDAIVVVENIYRHVEEGVPPFEAALKGSSEIAFTVLSISLSLIAVFIPLLLMGGIIGRVFREFALTVTAAILVSCVVSLTLAPMLCSRFMKRVPDEHGPLYRVIEQGFGAMLAGYRRTLDVALRYQAVTLGVFFATLALTIYMAVHIPKGFFPSQDIGVISGISEAVQAVSPYDAPPAAARGSDPARGIPDRQHRQPQCGQYRKLYDHSQAARPTQRNGAAGHRSVATAVCADRRRQRIPSAGAGHQRRRPHRARQLAVHAAKRQPGRSRRVVAKDARQAAHDAADRRRDERSARQWAAAQDRHQPRPGLAIRHSRRR
jgi:multidrug efflux pump subunit AcrB